jgi:hypothetical protein
MKNRLQKYYTYGIIALWGIACFVFFQGFYSYHFFYREQTQLFLLSSDYLSSYFSKPAWLSCMTGDFLTQFYYYRFAGALILTVTLLMAGDVTRRSLERCHWGKWAFWAALVVMTVEAIFNFRAEFSLSSTISIIGAMMLFLLYTFIQKEWMKWTVGILLTLLSYWLFGYGCIVFALLALLRDINIRWGWTKIALLLIALIFPPLVRGHYLLTWQDSLTYPGIGRFQKPNFNTEKILALDNEYYFGNYDKVLRMIRTSKPLPEASFFYNLIQARQGALPDSLLYSNQPINHGLFIESGPDAALIDLYINGELFDLWNDMTLDEHSTILANVFSPNNRNVRMVKRLAEINLVNNDTTAALKYLRLLQKTLLYKKWANERIPGKQSPRVMQFLQQKRQFINKQDTVRNPSEKYLSIVGLLRSNPKNIPALDYLLCSDLLAKDISGFKRDYDTFCFNTHAPRTKKLYQEALMIYLAGSGAPISEWIKYGLSEQIGDDFKNYTTIYQQTKGNSAALSGQYSHTYWYYFHFANSK